MLDRVTALLADRLRSLAARKSRFCYDVRGNSHVYDGIVAPYRVEVGNAETHDLMPVLEHALVHDGMVTGEKDPGTGRTRFSSGRHFTDTGNALRFAREQGRDSVFNWNRMEAIPVAPTPVDTTTTVSDPELDL